MSTLRNILLDCVPPVALRTYRALRHPAKVPANPLEFAHLLNNQAIGWNEIVLRPGMKLKIASESRIPFEYFCFRDAEMVSELDQFLRMAQGKSRLLDVGALHGIFSLAFVMQDTSRRALALEPSPLASPFLLYNIQANAPEQIKFVESALGDRNENIRMTFEWQHLVALGESGSAKRGQNVAEIRSQRGDDLCWSQSFEPDLIKMDVEGFEFPCLVGLRDTLKRCRPSICLEIHPRMPDGCTAAQLAGFLTELGYRFYNLNDESLSYEDIAGLEKVSRVVVKPS